MSEANTVGGGEYLKGRLFWVRQRRARFGASSKGSLCLTIVSRFSLFLTIVGSVRGNVFNRWKQLRPDWGAFHANARYKCPLLSKLQGYLAHKKMPSPGTLQQAYV